MESEFVKGLDSNKIITLDVRPIIETGRDPFQDIMSKVKVLQDDSVFHLINSFEPIPLYSVLGKKGFDHKTIRQDGIFNIYFYKTLEKTKEAEGLALDNKGSEKTPHEYENIIEIDARELVPPEPMVKVLEALSKVDDNTILVLHHHREPLMLYPKLEERGYTAICNKIKENEFKIIIMKKRNEGQ